MELVTQRLILHPVGLKDFQTLKQIFTDSYVRRDLFDNKILSDNEIREFINTSLQTFLGHRYGLWLISKRETGETIGVAGLWRFFEEEQPQLLYALLPSHMKHGYATEASLQLIQYAFTSLSYSYLDASCDLGNKASHEVAQRIGMKSFKEAIVDGHPLMFYRISR